MAEKCVACGKPITTVHDRCTPGVHLRRVWVHYSWWANRSHAAIPSSGVVNGHE